MYGSIKKILLFVVLSAFALFSAMSVARNFADGSRASDMLTHAQMLRLSAIEQLIVLGFDDFATMPFGPGNDFVHITGVQTYPEYPDFYLTTGLDIQDDLDILIAQRVQDRGFFARFSSVSADDIVITSGDIASLHKVYLFKSQADLEALGYVVTSYRTRINTDPEWRQANISNSYRNIGNVRVLNSDQELKFMDEIHYDAQAGDHKRDLAAGLANVGGLSMVKGGGICGAGRGIHSTILPNKAFEVLERHPHTISYNYLYEHTVNGQHYWIPGLDTSVYSFSYSKKDFIIKNIREYPVVLVMNYDGSDGGLEELFVLSKEQDRGYLKFIGSKGTCYTREANERQFTSCYSKVVR